MWEIGARRLPYANATPTIVSSVVPLGDRESILTDCPPGYMDLVQQCWHQEPDQRPEIDYVLSAIGMIKESLQQHPI